MVSPPDGQSLPRGGARADRRNDGENGASKWLQRLLVSTGFVFFLGGLVVAGGPGVLPFLSDSGSPTVGGPVTGTPTPDHAAAGGTPTAGGTVNQTPTPTASGGRPGGGTPRNGSDATTPTSGSGGNGTATPTPTPDPIIGIG